MKYTFTLLLLFLLNSTMAQFDSIYVAILPFESDRPIAEASKKQLQNAVVDVFSQDFRMFLVDRSELDLVAQERELQKNEEFIDGKVVEQGKAVGAEYLVDGFIDYKNRKLYLKVFDVSNGSLKGSTSSTLNVKPARDNSIPTIDLGKVLNFSSRTNYLQDNVKKLIEQSFPEILFIVAGPESESKRQVKSLKVLAGSKMGVKKGQLLEVQVIVEEEVEGIKTTRQESAGWGRVQKVDGEVWSILKLEAGKANIKKHLKQGRKLRCRPIKK